MIPTLDNILFNIIEKTKPKPKGEEKHLAELIKDYCINGAKYITRTLIVYPFVYSAIGSFPSKVQERLTEKYNKWPLIFALSSVAFGALSLSIKYLSAKGILSIEMPSLINSIKPVLGNLVDVMAIEGIAETIARPLYMTLTKKPVGVGAMELGYFLYQQGIDFLYNKKKQKEKEKKLTDIFDDINYRT